MSKVLAGFIDGIFRPRDLISIVSSMSMPVTRQPFLFYRGTGHEGLVNELAAVKRSQDMPINRSASVCAIEGEVFRSKLWRGVGFTFSFDHQGVFSKLCYLGAKDGFTGVEPGKEDEFGNQVDTNEGQQGLPVLSEAEYEESKARFITDSKARPLIIRGKMMNEAVLRLDMGDYLSASLCLNADFALKTQELEKFRKSIEVFDEFRKENARCQKDEEPAVAAFQYKGQIFFIAPERVGELLDNIAVQLPSTIISGTDSATMMSKKTAVVEGSRMIGDGSLQQKK
jgi:hypothetical protein